MINQACCFTGHRKILEEEKPLLEKRLEAVIHNLVYNDVSHFYAGGALGFDTMAALSVLKLKSELPHVRLHLALPCKDQSKSWNEADKKIYNHILCQADQVVYASEHYFNGCMQQRNRYLVDHSQYCVCYLNESKGGTANTVNYALRKGVTVINLWFT